MKDCELGRPRKPRDREAIYTRACRHSIEGNENRLLRSSGADLGPNSSVADCERNKGRSCLQCGENREVTPSTFERSSKLVRRPLGVFVAVVENFLGHFW